MHAWVIGRVEIALASPLINKTSRPACACDLQGTRNAYVCARFCPRIPGRSSAAPFGHVGLWDGLPIGSFQPRGTGAFFRVAFIVHVSRELGIKDPVVLPIKTIRKAFPTTDLRFH